MTDKGKEAEKVSLRSQTSVTKTNLPNLQLFNSGQTSVHRPIYTSTSSIMHRPMSQMSSALITQPSYPRPRSPRPNFVSLNRFSPLQTPIKPITPSTFKQAVTGPSSSSPKPIISSDQSQSEYKYKSVEDYILTIEPEYWAQNPNLNVY